VFGATGLILPGLLRRHQQLTPLAAIGLSIIMLGATVLLIANPAAGSPVMPTVVGLLDGLVARGRWDAVKRRSEQCFSPSQS